MLVVVLTPGRGRAPPVQEAPTGADPSRASETGASAPRVGSHERSKASA